VHGRSIRMWVAIGLTPAALGPQEPALAVSSNQTAPPAAIHPLRGTGSGGAHGPSVIDSLQRLPSQSTAGAVGAHPPVAPPPRRSPRPSSVQSLAPSARQVRSSDNSVDLSGTSEDRQPGANAVADASAQQVKSSSFTTYSTQDVAGASDGRYIMSNGYDGRSNVQVIYTLAGSAVKSTPDYEFWCGGSNPSPGCFLGGFPADQRYFYDDRRGRWMTTAMWVFTSSPVPLDLLAVSQSSDPTGGWNAYEFPACGGTFAGGTDQPHSGFNDAWIAVASGCDTISSTNGERSTPLAVFAKESLYAGQPLELNADWWEFEDPYSNSGRNDPVATHAPRPAMDPPPMDPPRSTTANIWRPRHSTSRRAYGPQ
jgi:hypothetical protein